MFPLDGFCRWFLLQYHGGISVPCAGFCFAQGVFMLTANLVSNRKPLFPDGLLA